MCFLKCYKFDFCALCNWVCCIKNLKKKESKNRSQIKSGYLCFPFFCHYIVIFFMQTHGLHLWLRTEWVILPDYITYFQWAGQLGAVMGFVWVSSHTWRYSVFFKNSLNSPNALSDCSVITLGRAEMVELESYLLPSFPLRTDWKPCSGALAWSPVKTAF